MTDRMKIALQGLGYLGLTLVLAILAARTVGSAGGYVPSDAVAVPYFLTLILVATLALALALKLSKSGWPFQVIFVLAVWAGAAALFDVFFPEPWSSLAGLAVALAYFRAKSGWSVDLSLAVALAGLAGVVFSGFRPTAVVVIFTILAFYDILAVYLSGHMVRLFRGLSTRGVKAAFVLGGRGGHQASEVQTAFYLGTGDVLMPAILAASAARQSLGQGLAAALGALLGFLLTLRLYERGGRRPMPALPPIALGSIIFYLISLLTTKP